MTPLRPLPIFLAAGLIALAAPHSFALDRKAIVTAADQEHVVVIRATVPATADRIYGLLHDWSKRPSFQKAPTFDHWDFAADNPSGIGAWAEYDLRLGDQVVRQRQVIADDQDGRYIRERSDRPQLPYEVHWLLEPVGDGAATAVTIAIHVPQNRNWFAGLWQQWSVEPALKAVYSGLPGQLTAALATNP